jgi:hypothetical protein
MVLKIPSVIAHLKDRGAVDVHFFADAAARVHFCRSVSGRNATAAKFGERGKRLELRQVRRGREPVVLGVPAVEL